MKNDKYNMKKQYKVKENNDHEGETFNYVLDLTEEEAKIIAEKCEKLGDESLSISENNYTQEQIDEINNLSNNSYMPFIARYELENGALENWEEYGDCFYKGTGLTQI